jgi:hypothetical protein
MVPYNTWQVTVCDLGAVIAKHYIWVCSGKKCVSAVLMLLRGWMERSVRIIGTPVYSVSQWARMMTLCICVFSIVRGPQAAKLNTQHYQFGSFFLYLYVISIYLNSKAHIILSALAVITSRNGKAITAYGGREVELHVFLTSALMKANSQFHAPAALNPGNRLQNSVMGDWVGSRRGQGCTKERQMYCLCQRTESPFLGCSAHRLVTILTELWMKNFI